MPSRLICLLRLIIARAIKDDAFEIPFRDAEDILRRPGLGDVDYVLLRWKPTMMKKHVFPIKYAKYLKIWNRVVLVTGSRDRRRPYSMRVGAGGRLDGS